MTAKEIEKLFDEKCDLYIPHIDKHAMSKQKFIEIVSKIPENRKTICGNCDEEVVPLYGVGMCPACYCDI